LQLKAEPQVADFQHDAFISYSRKEQAFAKAMERELEKYKPPKALGLPQKNPDIFLDVEDFTGSDYSKSVEQSLTGSKKLMVLCSPNARRSQFVDDEIRRFVQARGETAAKDIIPVLVGGLPNNEADSTGQPDERAFPEELCKAMEMPLAADYRRFNPAKDKVHKGAFVGDWYKILSDLYEVSRSDIEQRERRRAATRRRITIGIVGTVIAVLTLALGVALYQRNEAQVALTESLVNSTQGLLSTNKAVDDLGSAVNALRAARQLTAWQFSPPALHADVRGALHQAVYGIRERNRIELDAKASQAAFSADGNRIGAITEDGGIHVWDRAGKPLAQFQGPQGSIFIAGAGFTADLDELVTLHSTRSPEGATRRDHIGPDRTILTIGGDNTIRLWDIGPHYLTEFKSQRRTFTMAMSDGAKFLASQDMGSEPRRDNAVVLWTAEGRKLGEFPSRPGNDIPWIFLSPDAARLAIVERKDDAHLWTTRDRQEKVVRPQSAELIGVSFAAAEPLLVMKSADGILLQGWTGVARTIATGGAPISAVLDTGGGHIVVATATGVSVWDLGGNRVAGYANALDKEAVVFAGSGSNRIALRQGGRVFVVDAQGQQIADFGKLDSSPVLSPDGRLLATSGGFYAVPTLWDVATKRPVARFEGNGDLDMRFSNDGKFLTLVGNDVPPRLWRVETPNELIARACEMVDGYLQNNHAVPADYRRLCAAPLFQVP
jgi:WD40 repeat protein